MITARDKWQEAKREAGLRRRVYPRWVEEGRMKMQTAELQILIMDAIVDDYRILAEREEKAGRLI